MISAFVIGQSPNPADAAPTGWQWPLDEAKQVSRPFVAPVSEFGPGHRGIDIPAVVGSDIVAPAWVRVVFTGRVVDRDVVTVDAGDGWLVSFDGATAIVAEGQRLAPGIRLATVADNPHCACVHVGLRHAGAYLNPLLVWGQIPHAVLLPW
jgi:murein DD-endopeptidase MepM/ murein hydrolase activator NlpD